MGGGGGGRQRREREEGGRRGGGMERWMEEEGENNPVSMSAADRNIALAFHRRHPAVHTHTPIHTHPNTHTHAHTPIHTHSVAREIVMLDLLMPADSTTVGQHPLVAFIDTHK